MKALRQHEGAGAVTVRKIAPPPDEIWIEPACGCFESVPWIWKSNNRLGCLTCGAEPIRYVRADAREVRP